MYVRANVLNVIVSELNLEIHWIYGSPIGQENNLMFKHEDLTAT